MSGEVTAVLFGLAAAASWGAGDFSGGLATQRSRSVLAVVILSQLLGGCLLALLALALREGWPQARDLLWGGAAGLSGAMWAWLLFTAGWPWGAWGWWLR